MVEALGQSLGQPLGDPLEAGIVNEPEWFGGMDAVSALFLAHHRLVGLASLLVDDRGTAEDVVQEAFVNLHRRWGHLRDPGSAVAYLNHAVVNGGRDRLRHARRVVAIMPRMVPVPEVRSSAEQDAVRHDEADRLWQAITAAADATAAGARPALLPRPERGRDRRHPRGVARFGEEARQPRPAALSRTLEAQS